MPADEAERRAGEDHPHDSRVARAEPAGLEQQRDDRAADRDERDRRRHDEEHDAAERAASRVCRCSARARRVAGRARHLRQLGGGDRHAEQADRQQVEHLRVRHRGDDAGAEEAREDLIDVAPRSAPSRGRAAPGTNARSVACTPGSRDRERRPQRRAAARSRSAAARGTARPSRSPRPTRARSRCRRRGRRAAGPRRSRRAISAAFHSTGET